MNALDPHNQLEGRSLTSPPAPTEKAVAPWELMEAGRYRPRRIRGSYRGRELG